MTMPTYEISVDGKPRKIELAKNGEGSFTVKADGKSLMVQLQADQTGSEKQFSLSIDGKDYQIELPRIDRGKPLQVKVNGATFTAELKMPTSKTATTSFAVTQAAPARKPITREQAAEGAITAPMTGKIVSVKVKKDDQVKANQVLCVIEAMKMENEICAPKAGVVQEVNVSQGSSVSEGDVLFVVG
jgi:biotin carboxyl carrier protein